MLLVNLQEYLELQLMKRFRFSLYFILPLASLLRDNGYVTGMVGKWHLGMDFSGEKRDRDWTQPVKDMPLDKGFDYFWGIPVSMNYGVLAWFDGRHAKVLPSF